MLPLALWLALAISVRAERVKCESIYLEIMPDDMARHASARLERLGFAVVANRSAADCLLIFSESRPLKPRAGHDALPEPPVVAGDTQERMEQSMQQARRRSEAGSRPVRVAAFGLVHRGSTRVQWSRSAVCDAARPPSANSLTKKLLAGLRKDVSR